MASVITGGDLVGRWFAFTHVTERTTAEVATVVAQDGHHPKDGGRAKRSSFVEQAPELGRLSLQ